MTDRPNHLEVLQTAQDYLRRGWSVMALWPKTKNPTLASWKKYQSELATEDDLRRWFKSDRNLAVILGPVSRGLVVRDFDAPGSYEAWVETQPDLARILPTVQTSRGYHVYCRMDPCPSTKEFADGEFRAEGAYIVAPPSTHKDGPIYRWIIPPSDDDLPILKPDIFGLRPSLPLKTSDTRETKERHKTDLRATEADERSRKQTVADPSNNGCSLSAFKEIVKRSIPKGQGQRHKALLALARRCLAINNGQPLPREAQVVVFEIWWAKARKIVATPDKDLSMCEFFDACDRAEVPLHDYLELAIEKASKQPLPSIPGNPGRAVAKLAGVLRELQRINLSGDFPMSSRKAQEILGMQRHHEPATYLKLLCQLGILEITKPAELVGRLATRYRYVGKDL